NDASWLLLEQALLVEGLPVDNPGVFVQRLNRVLAARYRLSPKELDMWLPAAVAFHVNRRMVDAVSVGQFVDESMGAERPWLLADGAAPACGSIEPRYGIAILCCAQLRMTLMPFGGLFVSARHRQHRRFRKRRAADLKTD